MYLLRKYRNYRKQNFFKELIRNGNLKIGENCNLTACTLRLPANPKNNHLYFTIGDNCMIEGELLCYTPESSIVIGNGVYIGNNTKLLSHTKITLQNDIMLSWSITVMDTDAHSLVSKEREKDVSDWLKGAQFKNWEKVNTSPITIESNSWIGFNSIILKGVCIGKGAIVAAGSVVAKSVESFSIVAGNPSTFVKKTS
jgi:acetyltransferase-like isoleucine patch superfamily enzyme